MGSMSRHNVNLDKKLASFLVNNWIKRLSYFSNTLCNSFKFLLSQYLKTTLSLNKTPLPGILSKIKQKYGNRLFVLAKLVIT